jgi:ribosomal protein L40E
MKLKILLVIVYFCITNIIYSQDWVRINITDFATIEFPAKSEIVTNPQELTIETMADSGHFLVTIWDINNFTNNYIQPVDQPMKYYGNTGGALRRWLSEGIYIDRKKVGDFTAIDMELEVLPNFKQFTRIFKQVYVSNDYAFSLDFWPTIKDSKKIDVIKDKFFGSLVIDFGDEQARTQDPVSKNNSPNHIYESGFTFGKVLFYLVLFGIIFGSTLFIRSLVVKKTKNKSSIHSGRFNNTGSKPTICHRCDAENKAGTKYCSKCGYELKIKND